jgi:hypothetical protein
MKTRSQEKRNDVVQLAIVTLPDPNYYKLGSERSIEINQHVFYFRRTNTSLGWSEITYDELRDKCL